MEENSQIDLLIVRKIIGTISNDEKRTLDAFISESIGNKEYVESFERSWSESNNSSLFYKINASEDWQVVRKRMGFVQKEKVVYGYLLRKIAAVLIPAFIILASVIAFYSVPGFGRLTAYRAVTDNESITLPDRSDVTLKEGSKLIVVRGLKGKSRRVKLSGEAYFEIEKDRLHPFIISIAGAKVEVVGTAFDLENKGDNVIINVIRGVVRFSANNREILVHKGEEALFDGKNFIRKDIRDNNFIAWKTGVMDFNNAGIEEIMDVVVDTYGEVKGYKLDKKSDIKVTTIFRNQPLTEVVDELQIHFNKKIVLHDGILVISD